MNSPSSHPEQAESLRRVDVFGDLSDEHLQQIAQYTVCESLPAGAVVFREGDAPHSIYLVDAGLVALEIQVPGGGSKRIHTVGEGELLGWTPALGESRMTATARTLSETRACRIDAKQILALCEQNPRFGYEFMRRTALALSKRLTATRLQFLDVFQHDLPHVEDDSPDNALSQGERGEVEES